MADLLKLILGFLASLFKSRVKAPVPFCCDRQVGQNIALNRGSWLQPGACIAMFWQLRSPTSWRGSLGPSWHRDVAIRLASSPVLNRRRNRELKPSREPPRWIAKVKATKTERFLPRSASWVEEMEKRSHRRVRDLDVLAACQGLVANEIGCARISMVAREAKRSLQRAEYRCARPITSRSSYPACTARPVHTQYMVKRRGPPSQGWRLPWSGGSSARSSASHPERWLYMFCNALKKEGALR